ncbi:arsenate reductase (glutaredoxin) [Arenibacter troitsensis]|uniref:Arsenate reductase n=1 Tax=Arenibacter troitsensis TaxID=188872 RepID=A0A1X7JGR3_9FLAO|nr:arsenate reductase (glutaredoxin) [Arenibacter troitsensis]MDX1768968.1 arsenate reductase (glutaredoxin) [Arenibacter troitsensis]SMG26924.1 arsenate reductase [Arenibacter troitsensis]
MIKIYHNPRCGKSREGLAILENSENDFEIIKYLENVPSKNELAAIIKILGISPMQLVRTNEAIWKEKFKGKSMTDDEVIAAMVAFPKLIERPIVIKDKKGVVGRPPEKIKDLFN